MKYLLILFIAFLQGIALSQDIWTIKDSVNGPPRANGATFIANGDGFVSTGYNGTSFSRKTYSYTLWQDDWDDEPSLGGQNNDGIERAGACGFSLGNLGYICLGKGEFNTYFNDLWSFDAVSNTWTQKADFIGEGRCEAVAFSIDNYAYVGTGQGESGLKKDMYKYFPESNHWEAIAIFPSTARKEAVGFNIGNRGYVGTGDDGAYKKDFWEYNPSTNSWSQKPDFPGTARKAAIGWGQFPQGFIGTGEDLNFNYQKDIWEYNRYTNAWVQRSDFLGSARSNAIVFVIDYLVFVGMGYDGEYHDDMYSYNRVLGTDELLSSHVKVYPNPSTDFVSIEDEKGISQIHLYSINGQELELNDNFDVNQTVVKVNLTSIPHGNYLLSWTNSLDQKIQKQIVVQ